jgi:WD40 repeat protein
MEITMGARRNIRQLATLWGLALGLMTNSAFASAPLCSQVLRSAVAHPVAGQIDQALQSLAKLKLELDLAQSEGTLSSSIAKKTLARQYDLKLQELFQDLRDTHTEAQLRGLISQRIHDLQNSKIKDLEKEVSAKDSVRQVFAPQYKLQERIEVPFHIDFFNSAYAHERKLFFFKEFNDNKLQFFDLVSKERQILADQDAYFQLTPDQKKLAIISDDGVLRFFDTATRALSEPIDLAKTILNGRKCYFGSLAFDPSGEILTGYFERGVFIYNMISGALKILPMAAQGVLPLSTKKIVVAANQEVTRIIDLDTGNTKNIGHSKDYYISFLSSDSKQIALESRETGALEFFDLEKPGKPTLVIPRALPKDTSQRALYKTPGMNYVVADRTVVISATFTIQSIDRLYAEPLFIFDYNSQEASGITYVLNQLRFSPDGKTVLMAVDRKQDNQFTNLHYIDIWSIQTGP